MALGWGEADEGGKRLLFRDSKGRGRKKKEGIILATQSINQVSWREGVQLELV